MGSILSRNPKKYRGKSPGIGQMCELSDKLSPLNEVFREINETKCRDPSLYSEVNPFTKRHNIEKNGFFN